MALELLVVDDEQDIRELVSGVLEDEGYAVRSAANSTRRWRRSRSGGRRWSCSTSGCRARARRAAAAGGDQAPRSHAAGADDLGPRQSRHRRRRDPPGRGRLHRKAVRGRASAPPRRARDRDRPAARENATCASRSGRTTSSRAASVAINTVRATLKRVAPTGSRVLITGPAGRRQGSRRALLHNWSTRAKRPSSSSRGAMTPERVEEELFGVEEGGELARPGLLEQAHGGTLFLDEIADMPLTTQARSCAC
jgi:two-component system nitrogen regulation response regulator NtrX